MNKLILDLRGNPGGYMDIANSIIDEFLEDGKLIVFTKNKYGEVKNSFDTYVYTMNQLYKLVIDREVMLLADKEKTRLDILKQYEYQVDSRGRGRVWKGLRIQRKVPSGGE